MRRASRIEHHPPIRRPGGRDRDRSGRHTLLGREVENEGDDDDDLTLDQVPGPARAALLELAGGAKITEVERECDPGGLVYEAEWIANRNTGLMAGCCWPLPAGWLGLWPT
ncbi:MAG: hypothetical protein IID40_01750 [Planctomycetes bacterium]|nr:hypothetical protein [Planctomycetota bacterium]